jgi:hypothetical protein
MLQETLADATFHGFKLDHSTGNLTIDIIDDDTMAVKLPQEDVLDPEAYKSFFWTRDTIKYSFDSKGHLIARHL